MKNRFAILGVSLLLVLIALLVVLLNSGDRHVAPIVTPDVPAAVTTTTATALAEAPKTDDAPVRTELTPEVVPVAPAPSTHDTRAEIKGRFLLPGGAPAAHVRLEVNGWESNSDRVRQFGRPDHFEPPTGESDAEGRFSLRMDPPRAYQFVLDAKLEGWVGASWRWSEIAPAKVVDLGDVVLVRGGCVRARVVDSNGKVLGKGWTVYADSQAPVAGENREPVRARSSSNGATGDFELPNLPPGLVGLKAYSEVANWIDGPTVVVRAGEETKADVVYKGPDISTRITVIPFTRPFYTFENGEFDVHLSGPGVSDLKATKLPGSSQSWTFQDLAPGAYHVEIRDSRFQPWSKDGVEPGSRVEAKLMGSAAVTLSVVDDETGAPIPRCAVDVRFDGSNSWPNVFRVLEAKQDYPPNGHIDGLVPGDQTIVVTADGYPPLDVAAPKLVAGETRALSARMSRGRTVTGVVRTSSGMPIAGVGVNVLDVPKAESNPRQHAMTGEAPNRPVATTDSSGHFELKDVPVGSWRIEAVIGGGASAGVALTVVSAVDPAPIELVFPPTGRLVGRLIGPKGASFDGLTVSVLPSLDDTATSPGASGRPRFVDMNRRYPIASDGSFTTDSMLATEVAVALCSPSARIPTGPNSWTMADSAGIALGKVTLAPDVDTRHEFDVRDLFPGSADVTVIVNGAAGANAVITANSVETQRLVSGGVTDENGVCHVLGLPPGVVRFSAHAIDSSWATPSQESTVRPNSTTQLTLSATLLPGLLLVRAGDPPAPLADARLSLLPDGDKSGFQVSATTDSKGLANVSLPAGRWRATRIERTDGKWITWVATFDWGVGGAGPLTVDLRVEQR